MKTAMLLSVALLACGAGLAQAKPMKHPTAPQPAAPTKAAIQALENDFAAKGNAGDAAGIGKLYALDAMALPPGAKRQDGRPAIQAFWAAAAQGVTDITLTTVDVKPLGPGVAQEIGAYAMKTKGPAPQALVGKYVVIWKKVGPDWKLATDIWNADS